MMAEYREIVDTVLSFLGDCRYSTPSCRYVIISPTTEHGDVVVWPIMVGFARKAKGCVIDEKARSFSLPNMTEVRCLAKDKVLLLRGVKVTGALFLECANDVQMVEMLKLERRIAEERLPSPRFGLA